MRAFIMVLMLSVLCLASCSLEPPMSDLLPPSVWRFSPRGEAVDSRSKVEVVFTEPVHPMTQALGLVALVAEADYDQALLDALDDPPMATAMQARCVPGRLDFIMGGSGLRFTPDAPLASGTHYALLVSAAVCDLEGNRLVDEIHLDAEGRHVGEPAHAVHWFRTRF